LWLGASGLGTLGSMPWMVEGPGGRGAIAGYAFVLLGAAAILWLVAGPLTRAMFARPDRDVPFALSARGVPALASFVAGLFVLVGAVPQAVSWVGMQVMLRAMPASLLDSSANRSVDLQSAGAGAEIVARLVVGAALVALSRRPDFWPIPDDGLGARAAVDQPRGDGQGSYRA
jgi:hypothetical protein